MESKDKSIRFVAGSYKSNKAQILINLLNKLMDAPTSSSTDVLANYTTERINKPVYTKKIKVGEETSNGVTIEYASISSYDKDFKDASYNDIRLAFLNTQDQWCNIYATELTQVELAKIYEKIKEVLSAKDHFILSAKIEKCIEIVDDCSEMIEEFEKSGVEIDYTDYVTEEEAATILTILNKIQARFRLKYST